MSAAQRIDTHTHILPPDYRKWLISRGLDAGGAPLPEWSVERALENMAASQIEVAVLSVSTPGVEPASPEDAPSLARDLNEYCSELADKRGGRFGFLATLPASCVDASVREAVHALDALGASGVILPAHVKGGYLGEPLFEPLMQELNRREAVVFVHPSEFSSDTNGDLPAFAADFLLDTVRAAVTLCRTGTVNRFPNIKFLLSNAGGFLPYAAWRVAATASPKHDAEDGLRLLKRFYFETSLSSTRYSLPSLLAFAAPTHVMFGTDFPYAPREAGQLFTAELDGYADADLIAINNGNARLMFADALAGGRAR